MPLPVVPLIATLGRSALMRGVLASKPLVTQMQPAHLAALIALLNATQSGVGAMTSADSAVFEDRPRRRRRRRRGLRRIGRAFKKLGRVARVVAPIAVGALAGGGVGGLAARSLVGRLAAGAARSAVGRISGSATSAPAPTAAPEAFAPVIEPAPLDLPPEQPGDPLFGGQESSAPPSFEGAAPIEEAASSAGEPEAFAPGEAESSFEEQSDSGPLVYVGKDLYRASAPEVDAAVREHILDLVDSRVPLAEFADAVYDNPVFDVLSDMLDEFEATTPDIETDLSEDGLCEDGALNLVLGDFNGSLPLRTFYRSRLIEAKIGRLAEGVHGEVNLGTFPFPVTISNGQSPARATVALAHELAHVANKLYKLGLSHPQVHELGVFYSVEGLPALLALRTALARGDYGGGSWLDDTSLVME